MKTRIRRNTKVISLLIAVIMLITIVPSTPAHAVSRSILGEISCGANQTIPLYTGPSVMGLYQPYATIGAIENGWSVYIVGEENGWYQILMGVGGLEATAYVPKSQVIQITAGPIQQISFTGGLRYSAANQQVWSIDEISTRLHIGNLSYDQSFTLLYQYNHNGYSISYIEFSTPSGPARGYLFNGNMFKPHTVLANGDYETKVARVISNATVYHENNAGVSAGSVYTGEIVTVITKNGDWVYVEYNVSAGRKRGFMSANCLSIYAPTGYVFKDNYMYSFSPALERCWGTMNIYAGPNNTYPLLDTVTDAWFFPYYNSMSNYTGSWCFVSYQTSNGTYKAGWTP